MGGVIRFLAVLGGAFAAWGLWIGEVLWVKGWAGLAWLSGFNWSALPICALIIVITGYFVASPARWARRAMFFATGCVLTVAAFMIARWATFDLFSGGIPDRVGVALAFVSAALIVCVGLPIFANWWLAPLHYWTGILIALALLLVVPLSFATIKVFPAFNGSTDELHSIKMGYPVFWSALLLPVAMRLGRKNRA